MVDTHVGFQVQTSSGLGLEISLDQVNVSSQADLTLSAETRTRLQTVHSADFSLYESLNDPI